MQLLNEIRQHPTLSKYLCDTCQEHNVSVVIDSSVDKSKILVIKVDDYYKKEAEFNKQPKSPDCLIIQFCENGKYLIYLVELKDIASLGNYKLADIREKFQNCFSDFMSDKFRQLFYNLDYDFSIRLLFISDPKEISQDKKVQPSKIDNLLAMPPCIFANRRYIIEPKTPNPTIKSC